MLSLMVRPMDSGPLGLTRMVVGIAAVIRAFVALPVLLRLADPGIIGAPVFRWMPEPSEPLAWALFLIWIGSALLFLTGCWVSISGSTLAGSLVFMLLYDQQTYSNHLYLMALLVGLLVLADSGAGRSLVDRSRPVATWGLWLLMAQVSIVYFFSALSKINETFLSGRVLAGVIHDGLIQFPDSLRTPRVLSLVALGAVLTEFTLAFGLWVSRVRPIAFILGLCLHLSIVLLMADTVELLVFALLMLAVYPLFHSTLRRPDAEGLITGQIDPSSSPVLP